MGRHEMLVGVNGLTYREYRPPAALAGLVACCWTRDRWRPPDHDLGVLPDGRVDLIWGTGGEVLVIGPQTRSLGRPLPPQSAVVGVRFVPGVGPPLFGVAAHELVDLHLPLAAIDARPATALLRDLSTIEEPTAAPAVMMRAIARRVSSVRYWSCDPIVRQAATLLENPRARVGPTARDLALSERQLERRFREVVGYGPKTLQRVLRFQRLLGVLELGCALAGGLARLAVALGYSDQSHLTRETREIAGLTPPGLERALGALRDQGASGIFKTGPRKLHTGLALELITPTPAADLGRNSHRVREAEYAATASGVAGAS